MDLDTARTALLGAIPEARRESAAAYIDETPYREGEPVPAADGADVADEPLYLGFVDLEPGRNWGHACLYVRCGAAGIRADPGLLPPRLAAGRSLRLVSAGALVPEWALLG